MANPKIIVQAFAALDVLYPERIGLGLGLGTGEAMNESPSGKPHQTLVGTFEQ
jgi:alkanesulfonate monooxygenase SsuD/methylene tetrahydromethanopterin reductase-like flavin-dependent oxidoreductase (luciferase family)